MLSSILKTIALKLLTEKVIIKLTLSLTGHLVKKTDNKLDDELYATIKKALE